MNELSKNRQDLAPEGPFAVLMGDLVASREIGDRSGVQRALRDRLASLNRDLAAAVAADLRVTAGDEFQGLLHTPEAAVEIAVDVSEAIHPVGVAYGLGRGPLSTALSRDVTTLDGPCFHRAREALEGARGAGVWLRTGGLPAPVGAAVDALFRLMGAIRAGWTETQATYVRAARGRLQREVAEEFGVNPSVVSKSLKAARFRDLLEGESAARELLAEVGAGGGAAEGSPPGAR